MLGPLYVVKAIADIIEILGDCKILYALPFSTTPKTIFKSVGGDDSLIVCGTGDVVPVRISQREILPLPSIPQLTQKYVLTVVEAVNPSDQFDASFPLIDPGATLTDKSLPLDDVV